MKSARILITGGSGFVGRHLTTYLSPRHKVYAPTHAELNIEEVASIEHYFNQYPIDYILHAAFLGGKRGTSDSRSLIQRNVRMFLNLAQHADHYTKMVIFGSGAEYDKSRSLVSITESDFGKHIPSDPYGYAKFIIATLARRYSNIVNLRLFGIFGPYEDVSIRFISQAIKTSLDKNRIVINQNVRFDYLWISDLMPVIDYVLAHEMVYPDYNIASGRSIDLVSIAKIIASIHSDPLDIDISHMGYGNEYTASIDRMLGEIPSFTPTSITTAIQLLYDWYNDHSL